MAICKLPCLSLGHRQVNYSQPTFGSLYPAFDPTCSTSSPSSSSLGEADQLDSQCPSQSTAKKYDKWTNEQQRYLVQLWADKQDMINSTDSRNAWREIAETINNKFKTHQTVDKCLPKIKYLIDGDKEKKKNGTEIRQVVTYEGLFSMMN